MHFSGAFPKTGEGYAVVISKKTLPRAVDRHRLKRRILETLWHQPTHMLPKALILFPKASALQLSPEELYTDLTNLLSRQFLK